jgi:hypothetical protein
MFAATSLAWSPSRPIASLERATERKIAALSENYRALAKIFFFQLQNFVMTLQVVHNGFSLSLP